MKKTKKLNLDAFKLNVKQENKKIEELMGGKLALASCHQTMQQTGYYLQPDKISDPSA